MVRPPRQLPACDACQHFTPDPINPPAGMGTCGQGHGMLHAGVRRHCNDFKERKA